MSYIYEICHTKSEEVELPQEQVLNKFFVAGIINSPTFQKARFIVTKLHKCFPKQYEHPEIRPMMDVDWEKFMIKTRRKYGDGVWTLNKNVVVFLNGKFLGDDDTLLKYITKTYRISLKEDWYEIAKCHLIDYLRDIMGKFRHLVYLTVSIKHRVIGTMLFELYSDLVPLTCENFLKKCTVEYEGYTGKPIQRVVKNGWVQCGGWTLPEVPLPCENYVVPHNRRGVLSMCNSHIYNNNSTQFFITLAPTPWMDYRYVAFGQLLQGAQILKQIEAVPTEYESPKDRIDIVKCGELTFTFSGDSVESLKDLKDLTNICPTNLLDTLIEPLGPPSYPSLDISQFDPLKLKKGDYSFKTDVKHYCWPFGNLSDYLNAYLIYPEAIPPDNDTIAEFVDESFRKELEDYSKLPSDPLFSNITI